MLKHRWVRITAITVLAIAFLGFASQKSRQEKADEYDIIAARKVDTDGKVHHLGIENKKAYPVAVVFLEVGCVVSQRMVPELNNIYKQGLQQEVRLYGVISNEFATWQEAQKFKAEFDIQFPLLFDANGDLAARLKPSTVPECFVFDINDRLAYHGRINDLFVAVGKINKAPRQNELREAIGAVAKGGLPAKRHEPAVGCVFQPWSKEVKEVTYNKQVEPILRANCRSCHRPNEIAPFSLMTYQDAARRGNMIEFVTRKGYMPIWKGEKGYGKFSNEHTLSNKEIELIGTWVKTGMKEGKPEDAMPQPTIEAKEWKLGKPDLILEMEPYALPASGDDQYRVFVMPTKIPKGKIIRAIDFKPGDPSVVHHSTIFVDYTGKLRQYDAEDPKPGYDAFKKGGTMEFGSAVPICGWAPGVGAHSYPDNIGFYVESDAHIAFENHYHLSGKATTDKSYIGVYYADQPVNKFSTGAIMGTQQLQVPADEARFEKTVWTYIPVDIELFDVTPHMHYIGKSVKVDVILPDGKVKKLLKVEDWDLRWQSVYTLRELMPIPKGSIITATFAYDNSDDNGDNPNYPAEEIYWGWGSEDEMCELYFSFIPVHEKDYEAMAAASFASFEHFYPYDKRVVVNNDNVIRIAAQYAACDVWSDDGQKLLVSIIESRKTNEVYAAMKKGRLLNTEAATVNIGELMMAEAYASLDPSAMQREPSRAADDLYKLFNAGAYSWNLRMSYGKIMLYSGDKTYEQEGETILRSLITEQENKGTVSKHTKPYWELGKYYYAKGEDDKAESVLKQGLAKHPDNIYLKQELASGGRIVKKHSNAAK